MMMSCLSVLGSSAKNPGRFGWVIGVSRSRSPRMIIVGAAIFFGSVSGIFVLRSRRTPFGAFGPHCVTSLTHVSTAMASEAGSSNRPRALSGRNSSLGAWPLGALHSGGAYRTSRLRMLHGEEACDVGAPRPTEQMDFVNTAQLADVIDCGVDVVGGDQCGDAETAGVVIGAAVVLVVDGEDVEPLAGEVVHERVGHGRLLRDLEIERDTPRRPGAVRKQYDLTRPGKGRRIAGPQPLLPDIEFNRLAIGARNALDPVLGTGNRLVGRRHGRVQ